MASWVWGVGLALVGAWVLVAALLLVLRPPGSDVRDAVRLLPDLVRFTYRLARDPSTPRRSRWALGGLAAYLALPVDLVPDFVPVIGYADDVVVVLLVLRYVIRRSDADVVARLWPGNAAGLATTLRLLGGPAAPVT